MMYISAVNFLTNVGERFMNPRFGIGIRRFLFEQVIDQPTLTAKIENGVLELNLPKSEGVKPKSIAVT